MSTAPETLEYKLIALTIATIQIFLGGMIARELFYPGWMYYAVIAFAVLFGAAAGVRIARQWELDSLATPRNSSDRRRHNYRRVLPYAFLAFIVLVAASNAMR